MTCVSALPAEENGNMSSCWGRPAAPVGIRHRQRDVELTWEGQELNWCLPFFFFVSFPRDNCSVAKFCRACAVIVVRIAMVKISETSILGSVYFQGVFEETQIHKSRAHPQLWSCFNSQTSAVRHKSSCAKVYPYAKLRFLCWLR